MGLVEKLSPMFVARLRLKERTTLFSKNALSFASTVKKLINSTKIIHIGQPQIFVYEDSNPFEDAIKLLHGEKTSLWHNMHCILILNLLTLFFNKGKDIIVF